VTAKLLYGTAFRAPSFNEAYSINNPVQAGNPGLHPETLRTGEADLSWQARHDVQLNLSLFSYQIHDIIRAVANAAPGTGATVQNSGDQDGHGGELEAVWQALDSLRLSGNYAYQHGVDKQSGGDAGYAPHRHVFVLADWRLNSYWKVGAQGNWVADRERIAGDTRPPLADYATLDLNLRYSANPARWSLMAGVRNVFAADAREPTPAPAPGLPAAIPQDLPVDPRTVFLQGTVTF
jgi:iron complex outermembrane receptor protein